jgi:multiple sugar transport system substrate-binding protein
MSMRNLMGRIRGRSKHFAVLSAAVVLATTVIVAGGGISQASTPKTLKVMYWSNFDNPGTNAIPKLIKAAAADLKKQHPGTNVVLEPITTDSESTYYAKIDLAQRSAATAPDVVMEDSFLIGSDASAGYIQALPKITSWSGWSHFPTAMQNIAMFNGKIYGVMNSTDVQLIFYDKALFKKAGITVPWQPKSLADIVTAAKALKKVSGIVPTWLYTGTPLGEASSFRGFEVFLNGSNDRLYDTTTNKWEISGPGFNAAWNFLASMRPYAEPEAQWSNPNASATVNLNMMPANKVGIVFDGSWISTAYVPGGPKPWPGFFSTFGEAQIPATNGGFTDQSGGFVWSVSTHSANTSLATSLVEDLSSAPNIAAFDALDGNSPPRSDAVNQPQWTKINKIDPVLTFATAQLAVTTYRPNQPLYPQISNEIAALTGDISSGSMSPKQAEAAYAVKVTQIVGAKNTEKMTK